MDFNFLRGPLGEPIYSGTHGPRARDSYIDTLCRTSHGGHFGQLRRALRVTLPWHTMVWADYDIEQKND